MFIKANFLILPGTSTVTEIKILSCGVVLSQNRASSSPTDIKPKQGKQLSYRYNHLIRFFLPVIFISVFPLSHIPRIRQSPEK
jgi:hypothetical protein